MSVRQSLLAILGQGPCYGYQLRSEFDRRTGSTWPLNVGQIYNTLDRLERDGLVGKSEADAQGHVFYAITEAGSTEAASWLRSPVARAPGTRDELAVKVAVAATLPGVDASAVVQSERAAAEARREALLSARSETDASAATDLAAAIVLDSMVFAAEAEVRWLDSVDGRLARHPEHALALELDAQLPKRGRPAREA